MGGSVPFEDALAARLALFNPSLSQVEEFLAKRPPRYGVMFHVHQPFIITMEVYQKK